MEPSTLEIVASPYGDVRADRRVRIALISVRFAVSVREFVVCDALDLSRGGMFLRASRPAPVGRVIRFELRVVAEERPLVVIGRVMWTRSAADGELRPAGMGIKFIDVDPIAHEVIGGLVAVRQQTMHGIGSHQVPPPRIHGHAQAHARAAKEGLLVPAIPLMRRPEPSVPFLLVRRKPRASDLQLASTRLRATPL
ncbi:MAG TPA: PilZ domain-containing protein [Polyangiaceae bacterium]